MTTKATKEDGKLEPTGPGQLESIPAYIKQGSARGTEKVTMDDMVVPRIAIAQANSPQRKRAHALFIEGLLEGHLFNTVTNEIYGERFTVIPLFFFKQRMKFPKPFGSGGGIECRSLNGINGGRLHPQGCETCPHSQFKAPTPDNKNDTRPDCDTFLDIMCLLPNGKWAVLSNKSSNIKVTRQFLSKVRMSGQDMFAKTLVLETVSKTEKGNQFYGLTLTRGMFVPESLYHAAETAFTQLHDQGIEVDTRGMSEETVEEDTNFDTKGM